MKRFDLETKKAIRRRVSAGMAVVVAITTIASVTYLQKREVKAKDTLDSITQLMTQINRDQPYNILEIVPDDVAFSISVNNSYGKVVTVSGNQTMGFMGYYIGGQEPVRKDIERLFGERKETRLVELTSGQLVNEDIWFESTISDANIRYEIVDRMLDALSSNGILNNTVNGRSPVTAQCDAYKGKLYYNAYREIREGEADKGNDVIDKTAADAGAWKLLNEHTYKTFIDTVSGNMTLSTSGNYIRKYERIVSADTLSDDAVAFLGAYLNEGSDKSFGDSNFSYISLNKDTSDNKENGNNTDVLAEEITVMNRGGDFEPNLVAPSGDITDEKQGTAKVSAVFQHIPGAAFGYIIDPKSVKNKVTSEEMLALGTPLYGKDGDIYYYVGTFGEVYGISENSTGNEDENTEGENNEDADNVSGNEVSDNKTDDEARIVKEDHLYPAAASQPYILGTILLDSGNDNSDRLLEQEEQLLKDDTGTDYLLNEDNSGELQQIENEAKVYDADGSDPEAGGEDANIPSETDNNTDADINTDTNTDTDTDAGNDDEPLATDTDEEYYAVRFIYTQDRTHDQYYGITGFFGAGEEDGAQYVVASEDSEYGTLVPTYVCESWSGCIKETENCDPMHFVYDYDSLGTSNYRFDPLEKRFGNENAQGIGVYRLRGEKIYYRLDLSNDNWFSRYVFDRDPSEVSNYPVEVVTVSVNKLSKSVLESRMIMLMSGDDRYCIGNSYKDYVSDNNIAPDMYKYMINRAAADKAPVVADYRIITRSDKLDEDNNGTGVDRTRHYYDVYAMVEALTLENLESYNERIKDMDLAAESNKFTTEELADSEMMTNNYHHFVNKNVYIYNMKTPKQRDGVEQNILNPYFYTMYDQGDRIKGFDEKEITGDRDKAIAGGFEEVLLDIQNENLYRKTDKSSGVSRDPLPEDITLATVLRYIAGYSSKRINTEKGIIRILELEPVASFDLQVDDSGTSEVNTFWKGISNISSTTTYCNGTFVTDSGILKYKNNPLINQEGTRIELTRMSVSEFVGHIEDLNAEYDMIYIGMNIGDSLDKGGLNTAEATDEDVRQHRANKKKEKIPVYNDPGMRGLVYSSSGDYRYMWGPLLGNKADDYVNGNMDGKLVGSDRYDPNSPNWRTRYSGNDISEQDVEKIYNFIDAGYPVVFDDGFYLDPTADKKVVNKAKVDSTSYMYALANNEWVLDQPNVFTRSNLTGSLFGWYLNLAKPEIKMYGIAEQSMSDIQYIELSKIDNFYHASFEFELSNKGAASSSSTYNAALYIDVNADGKYSHSQEGIRLTSLVDSMGNPVYGTEDAEGKNVTYELTTGERYIAQCQLARSYEGVVPWRIEITQNDNKLRRTNATGYYKIKKENYTRINALQIMQSGNYSGWRGGSWNMDTTSKDPNNIFCKLLDKDVIGYDMNITAIKSNDFLNHEDAPHKTEEEYYDILTQYDMLILGFADCYEAPNSDAAINAIRDYIEDGYSVLFSHDCTSFHSYKESAKSGVSNGSDWGTYWGYYFNTKIRNIVGMDRYNILNNVVEDGVDHTYDKLYRVNSGERSITFDNDGKLRTTIDASQDSYVPDHGYTYFNINKRAFGSIKNTNVNKLNLKGMPANMQTSQADNDTYEVTKVNDGQITKYPYVLPDRFTVANTHSQYFQLDFTADDDGDDESDIVVWYCMSDSNIKNHKDDGYEMSPNDVRNNYYIYNKGNITYTGVGHYHVIKDNGTPVGSEDEIKLFVNTLIACYQSGVHEPSLDVVESYENKDKKVGNIYLSYDQFLKDNETDTNGAIEKEVDIYFKTEKASLMQNSKKIEHTLSSALFYDITEDEYNDKNVDDNPDPTRDTDGYVKLDDGVGNIYYGRMITPTEFKYKGDYGEEDGDMMDLEDRVVYKATIPVDKDTLAEIWDSAISATSKNNRRVLVVTTDSSRNTSSERTKAKIKYSVAPVSLVRAQIFDLD